MHPASEAVESPGSPETFLLYERYPALRQVPRVELCNLPSPVQRVTVEGAGEIWIKRDDLNAPVFGGNKARSLEFLLGGLERGQSVMTLGGAGSTHVLATAIHAQRAGIAIEALRWQHDMNPVALRVDERLTSLLLEPARRSAAVAFLTAAGRARWRGTRLIPVGGSTPLGILGHVNAGIELARQIDRKELPMPQRIVVPLGSGGTTAGLLLGLRIAGLEIEIVGARVGPRLFVNRRAVLRLARQTAALIHAVTGETVPVVDPAYLRVEHGVYGGAYGRPLAAAAEGAANLHSLSGIRLDDTYSAKAWIAAVAESRRSEGPVLFWLTFDSRWLTN